MADVKHTQWAVFGTPADPEFACEITSAGGEIAAVYKHADAEERAHLIAASPDLLEALNACLQIWGPSFDASVDANGISGWGAGEVDAITGARAAIAKAGGAARATEGSV